MGEPLRLPEGYSLEMRRGEELDYLVLTRPDGTVVVAFEFSAMGPDPARIMQVAAEDAERQERKQQEEDDLQSD